MQLPPHVVDPVPVVDIKNELQVPTNKTKADKAEAKPELPGVEEKLELPLDEKNPEHLPVERKPDDSFTAKVPVVENKPDIDDDELAEMHLPLGKFELTIDKIQLEKTLSRFQIKNGSGDAMLVPAKKKVCTLDQ